MPGRLKLVSFLAVSLREGNTPKLNPDCLNSYASFGTQPRRQALRNKTALSCMASQDCRQSVAERINYAIPSDSNDLVDRDVPGVSQ